jgi:two-component system NtrC family response regulator
MKNINLLIIDDEKNQLELLSGYLKKKGAGVFSASSGNEGIEIVKNKSIDIIISDFKMPDKTGLEVLKEIKKLNPEIDFIIVTAFGTVDNAVQAIQNGAYDYIQKPIDLDVLDLTLNRLVEHKSLKSENELLKEQLKEKNKISSIISNSPKMEEVLSISSRAAESKATVLISGENGTGKEILARVIHYISQRKDKPFIAVNIPALSENLLESELFGHEKGSFTGADKLRKGRFELADKGTIFLDEIGDISPATQVKLLRVLQEQQIERVGGTEPINIDVRIIAATNQNLEKKIKEGAFREDLYYRLNIIPVHIPPLRERREDIMPLVEFFIEKYSEENNKPKFEISREAADLLLKYNYPGNVRELENIIERGVVLARGNIITKADLPMNVRGFKTEELIGSSAVSQSLIEHVENLEKRLIYDALSNSGGNQTKAGKLLGITERNLRYKIKKYGIKNRY